MALISNLFKSYCYGIGNLYGEYIESLFIMLKLLSQWYHTLLSQLYHRGCHGRSMGIVTPVPWSWKDRVLLGGTSVTVV